MVATITRYLLSGRHMKTGIIDSYAQALDVNIVLENFPIRNVVVKRNVLVRIALKLYFHVINIVFKSNENRILPCE